ncbi:MAG TPA: acyltransferase, partial [Flavisolibacter sp.]|nr:acyltransferase [Flavisolibacter sp.]
FVISGFLITSLLLKEEKETNTVSLRRFYFRRTLRIFPAYYFLLAVYFGLQLMGVLAMSASSWVAALTYTKNIYMEDWYTTHIWSLSLEEQFYLVWPLIFLYAKTYRKAVAWTIVAVVPLLRIADYLYPSLSLGNTSNLQRVDVPVWGCLFALYQQQVLGAIKGVLAKHRRLVLLPFFVLGGSHYFTQLNMHFGLKLGFAIVSLGGENGTIISISIGLILLFSAFYQGTAWQRFLDMPLLRYFGRLSYSIYLWQQIFIGTDYTLSVPPLNLLCIFAMANLSYYGIEKPLMRLRESWEKIPAVRRRLALLPLIKN